MPTLCFVCPDPPATRRLGSQLGAVLSGGDVVSLSGSLGAGKTCFVQGVAEGLAVPASVPVTSPTFTLVGEYPGRLVLRHADFYRVESLSRLSDAGFEDLLDERGALLVEWGERWPDALPDDRIRLHIRRIDGGEQRRIELVASGVRSAACLTRLSEVVPGEEMAAGDG